MNNFCVYFRFSFLLITLSVLALPVYGQKSQRDSTLITIRPDSVFDGRLFSPKSFSPVTRPFRRNRSGLVQLKQAVPKSEIKYDVKTGKYKIEQSIDGIKIGEPVEIELLELSALAQKNFENESFARLAQTSNNRRKVQEGLIDFKFSVPGGKESVFTTIFGKPEVNLRVTGTANMNIGASISRDENPSVPEDQRSRVDPTFEQNLKLNIQGGIGDKLTINTDWDTERPFDYQNRLRIVYKGYDDEIIKSIELGNVGMETGNSLISGGQALFGIKSVAQLGAFKLTSVISQKEGQGNSKSIDGGSTEEKFNIDPSDYEDDRHFYIDYYAYENYDKALANPILINPSFNINLNQIVVYKLNLGTQRSESIVQAVAFADLGVRKSGLTNKYLPPDVELDKLDDDYLDGIRSSNLDAIDILTVAQDLGVESQNVVKGLWIPLQNKVDYTIDPVLGTISLTNSSLQSNEALAVAFQDQRAGGITEIGDVTPLGEQILILKLIRQQNINPQSSTWKLTMRNVYSVGPSNISAEGFEFGMYYTASNVPVENLPGIPTSLMQLLGLDRVNQSKERTPDNFIDFSTGVLDGVNGKIYFPYREPFGERIVDVINQSPTITNKADAIKTLAFEELYTKEQGIARQNSKRNNYRMSGVVKGGTSGSFYLGYAIVEGSVKVLANGVELQEGLDYEVDYSIGNVFITNSRYLAKGQKITVDYESNNIVQIQQTTFTGVRGEYEVNDNIRFGATYFNLKDNPLTDKIRLGDEPINNSIYGFDAKAKFDAPWLTRFIDWLPIFETKSPSNITFSGEFAQLKPGIAQTNAVQSAIDSGRLYSDEEKGVSFIDEFEGSKTSFSFTSPARWYLAAAPASIEGYDVDLSRPSTNLFTKVDRADLRSQFAWYNIPINAGSAVNAPRNRETRLIQVQDVFDRQTLQQDNFINTLDVFYNPRNRGIYNYNPNLKNLLDNSPEKTWGGMSTVLPQGLENLNLNNIEFIEFWVQAIVPDSILPHNSTATAGLISDYNGKIYIDLGTISEDVIPNSSSNNEDGLSQAGELDLVPDQAGSNARSVIARRSVDYDGQFSINTLEQEDVGLDGIPNKPGLGGYSEPVFFNEFLEKMKTQYGENSPTYQKMLLDPSNDDYYYWAESSLSDATLQERFLRMHGFSEQNSRTSGDKRAITNRPDAEGLIIPTAPNIRDSYFQYEIELNPADPSSLTKSNPFIADITKDKSEGGNWYQIRIPLTEFKRKLGDVQDLQSVTHMRFWMSGYKRPFTLRFATFELVGSQWRKAENIGNLGNLSTNFFVSTINVEENRSRRPVPYVSPYGAIRAINRTQQGNLLANEQALSLQVHDLRSGDLRMIRRNFASGMNLINYSNLRMFVHAEGFQKRGELELIVRLGRDLEREYYEYRQPLSPTDTTFFTNLPLDIDPAQEREIEERVWLSDQNAMNIVLSGFNSLKQLRNLKGIDQSITFYDSTLVKDAPAGTRIGIRGNPSLQNISEIGIGVMNPSRLQSDGEGPVSSVGKTSIDAHVWVNELRVSGFDNSEGWSANTSAQVQLADIGSISGKLLTSTTGFGSLNSRLGTRQRSDVLQYDIATNFNAHKLLPEKYGWNLPIGFGFNTSTSTPQFLPRDGDIRLTDYTKAVRAQTINESAKDSIINNKVREIQRFSERYNITLSNFSKRNSKSKFLNYTLDNINFNYSYSQENSRSESEVYNKSWNFNTGLSYSYTFKKMDLLRPFWFTEKISYLTFLYDLQLGYMPSSINFSGTLARNYQERLQRPLDANPLPVNQLHRFDYNQSFGFSYNLTPTIPISFNSTSKYILNNIGERKYGTGPIPQFELIPTFESLKNMIQVDSIRSRKDTYSENYGASWRPQLTKYKALAWLTYSTTYRGTFRWQNSAQGSNLGASVGNGYNLDQSVSIKVQDILKKITFYEDFKKADEIEERERARIAATEKRRIEQEKRQEEIRLKNPDAKPAAPKKEAPAVKVEERENNLKYYSRKLSLAVFSMQNIDFSFGHGETSTQNGYSGGSSFFDSFNASNSGKSFAPPLSYRLGFSRSLKDIIGSPNLEENSSFQLNLNEAYTNTVIMSTKFQPFKNVAVDFDWNFGWNTAINNTNTLQSDNTITNTIYNESGDYASSAWVFGGDFNQFFKSQLQRGLDDYDPQTRQIKDENGNKNGSTILDRNTIQQDFAQTFLNGSSSTFGKNGYLPLPLPNWKLNWSGIEEYFDFASEYISRISLNHSYSGSYRVGWSYNPKYGDENPFNLFSGSSSKVIGVSERYEASTINIDRKFVPVVGLNITWKNNLSTRLQYDYSKVMSITTTSPTFLEKTSQGFTFKGTWSKRGFRLPFFKKLRNTLDLSVSGSYYDETNIRRIFAGVLANTLSTGITSTNANDYEVIDNSESSLIGDTRVKLTGLVGYQFSSMLKANFEYTYDHVIPKSTSSFERTTQNIRFNIIVSIRSN